MRAATASRATSSSSVASTAATTSGELFEPRFLSQSLALLEIAQSDRRAALVLYQAQQFPQAIFWLQQAVEKAVKSIGLSTRAIAPSDFRTRSRTRRSMCMRAPFRSSSPSQVRDPLTRRGPTRSIAC